MLTDLVFVFLALFFFVALPRAVVFCLRVMQG